MSHVQIKAATRASAAYDPDARRRIGLALLAVVVLWPLLVIAEFRPWTLFEPAGIHAMGGFLAGFFPPAHGTEFLGMLVKATMETLAMATAGIALAMLIGIPLAIIGTRALSVSSLGPGPGRWRGLVLRRGCRVVLSLLRSIPEIVWALMFVRVLGLGAAAGVLALAITYGGMLGKVYTEILESTDTRPARALLQGGSRRLSALFYGLVPNAAGELTSYTFYRWECAVRASVIMGFVGAGGLGQLMDQSMKMLNGGEACTILLTFLLLVLLADALSDSARKALA